jgi:hypothetical protein
MFGVCTFMGPFQSNVLNSKSLMLLFFICYYIFILPLRCSQTCLQLAISAHFIFKIPILKFGDKINKNIFYPTKNLKKSIGRL